MPRHKMGDVVVLLPGITGIYSHVYSERSVKLFELINIIHHRISLNSKLYILLVVAVIP